MSTINITIDNKSIQVEKGTTILKAAQKAGIHIPTLCYMHLEDLKIEHKPAGCRICVVEVAGRRNHRVQRGHGHQYPLFEGTQCPENRNGTYPKRPSHRLFDLS